MKSRKSCFCQTSSPSEFIERLATLPHHKYTCYEDRDSISNRMSKEVTYRFKRRFSMATSYTLSLDVSGDGVTRINSLQQVITIAKSTQITQAQRLSGPRISPTPVIWLAIDPFDSITVKWEADYFLYATDTFPEANASITVSSQTKNEVNAGEKYQFTKGAFTGPGQGDPGWMEVLNDEQDQPLFNFGLIQKATVHGDSSASVQSPLTIMTAGFNETVGFLPKETVQIFLYLLCSNGTVISFVADNALSLDLTPLNPSAKAYFDTSDNTFHEGIRPAKPSPIFIGKRS